MRSVFPRVCFSTKSSNGIDRYRVCFWFLSCLVVAKMMVVLMCSLWSNIRVGFFFKYLIFHNTYAGFFTKIFVKQEYYSLISEYSL